MMESREAEIRDLVRHVLNRVLRETGRGEHRLLTSQEVEQLEPGIKIRIEPGTLVTPMAREIALTRKILIEETPTKTGQAAPAPATGKVVALGADHGGYELKEMLKTFLTELGYEVLDVGTHSKEAVDYPDFAYAVAQHVASGAAFRGIIIDGAGIGSCMVANKVPGIRAAMCYDQMSAVNSRAHNDANVLTLGAGLLGPNLAKQIVKTWLSTNFEGGRHQPRIDKMMAIEARYLKK
ncbi:MAG: ribose 5-phosphate isomerase B [Anaerolineae bacterium]